MASYNGSIDLLAYNGAKMYKGIDAKHPERAFICIPVDANDIRVTTSRQNADKQIAGARVNIWPLSDAYKNKVRQSAAERGDTNVNVPTHEIQTNLSTDYIKAMIKAFPKLVDEVKEANKQRDPDIANQDPQDENTHLYKAIRNRMNKRIAMLYQPQNANAQAYQQPAAYQTAASVSEYSAPADGSVASPASWVNPDDDLPF